MSTKPTEAQDFQPTVSADLVKKSLLVVSSLVAFFVLIFWDVLVGYILVTKQHGNDFARFFWATTAFLDGQDMYGPTIATLKSHTNYFSEHLWNLNPPHFHLLLLPLSFLPFNWAFSLWAVVNFIALFVSLRMIFRETKTTMTTKQGIVGTLGLLAFTGTTAVLLNRSIFIPSSFRGDPRLAQHSSWSRKNGWHLLWIPSQHQIIFSDFYPIFSFVQKTSDRDRCRVYPAY